MSYISHGLCVFVANLRRLFQCVVLGLFNLKHQPLGNAALRKILDQKNQQYLAAFCNPNGQELYDPEEDEEVPEPIEETPEPEPVRDGDVIFEPEEK